MSLEDKAWFQLLQMAAVPRFNRQSKLNDYLVPTSSSADDDNHTVIENGKL